MNMLAFAIWCGGLFIMAGLVAIAQAIRTQKMTEEVKS